MFNWFKNTEIDGEYVRFKKHPLLDSKSLRVLQDKDFLKSLPIKYVDESELHKAMEGWFYNPVYYYANLIRPRKNECGHDDKYRYILSPTPNHREQS